MSARFHLPAARDVPPRVAAKVMGFDTVAQLEAALPRLVGAGFPAPDPITGNYPLEKIEAYRETRYPQSTDRPATRGASDVRTLVVERVARLRRG
jgi:hypothetical protein